MIILSEGTWGMCPARLVVEVLDGGVWRYPEIENTPGVIGMLCDAAEKRIPGALRHDLLESLEAMTRQRDRLLHAVDEMSRKLASTNEELEATEKELSELRLKISVDEAAVSRAADRIREEVLGKDKHLTSRHTWHSRHSRHEKCP
jgi:hypothetical protein